MNYRQVDDIKIGEHGQVVRKESRVAEKTLKGRVINSFRNLTQECKWESLKGGNNDSTQQWQETTTGKEKNKSSTKSKIEEKNINTPMYEVRF